MPQLPSDLIRSLSEMGFSAKHVALTGEPLTGGVASDIWRIDLEDRSVCAKRALAQLNVSQEWLVPVDRNAHEVAWFNVVAKLVPDSVPKILGHDPAAGIFIMEYLSPDQFSVWKTQLHEGVVELETAVALAKALATIHSKTASDSTVSRLFDHSELFCSLRLEPYFYATAEVHPDVQVQLADLATMVIGNRKVLIHGDISPKNILVGSKGPIIIDAECAWYGDPAFDVAFCLNHLLLKCIWNPEVKSQLIACFEAFSKTYLSGVTWESSAALEQRAARLLPGLMLARIDGKSPVEYVHTEKDRMKVRDFAKQYLIGPADTLCDISAAWLECD